MPENKFEKYPSVDLAYPVALTAYDWTVKRFDALDSKIQTILSIGVTVSLAIPVALSALKINADQKWLIGSMICFALAIALGTYARLHGALIMLSPMSLHEKWLHLEQAQFKADLIYFAGEHFNKNVGLLARKHRLFVAALLMFFIEIAFVSVSVAVGRS